MRVQRVKEKTVTLGQGTQSLKWDRSPVTKVHSTSGGI